MRCDSQTRASAADAGSGEVLRALHGCGPNKGAAPAEGGQQEVALAMNRRVQATTFLANACSCAVALLLSGVAPDRERVLCSAKKCNSYTETVGPRWAVTVKLRPTLLIFFLDCGPGHCAPLSQ